jgi:Skp family chaperone for outer membrane proteins
MNKKLQAMLCGVACTLAPVQATDTAIKPATTVKKEPAKVAAKHKGVDVEIRWAKAQEFNTSRTAQDKLAGLQALGEQKASEIQRMQEEFKAAEAAYAAKRSTFSKAALEAAEADLVKKRNELNSLVESHKLALNRAMQEATEEMVHDIEVVTAQIAKEQGIDVIMDCDSGKALYVSDKMLVTNEIAKELDKAYELKVAKKDAKSAAKPAQIKA